MMICVAIPHTLCGRAAGDMKALLSDTCTHIPAHMLTLTLALILELTLALALALTLILILTH
jgi:hypothetical protein